MRSTGSRCEARESGEHTQVLGAYFSAARKKLETSEEAEATFATFLL